MLLDRLEAMYAKERGTNILGVLAGVLHCTSSAERGGGRALALLARHAPALRGGDGQ